MNKIGRILIKKEPLKSPPTEHDRSMVCKFPDGTTHLVHHVIPDHYHNTGEPVPQGLQEVNAVRTYLVEELRTVFHIIED